MSYKKFLYIFFWIFCPVILSNIISMAVFIYNPQWFYYRAWEYFPEVAYKFNNYEASWNRDETSDLTRKNFFYYQDPHKTHVSVDKDGFRSNRLRVSNYKVLVSGDSTVFGSGLSDNETLPWKISKKTNLTVFNGGRSSLYNTLLRPELSNIKVVIDCRTERSIKGNVFNNYGYKKGDIYQPLMVNDKDIFNFSNEVPAQRYLITSIAARTAVRMINDLFILNTEKEEYKFINHNFEKSDLDNAIHSIIKRKEYINAQGIEYIFLAVPAKQTIYGKDIDKFTKNYIELLTDRLQKKGVKTIVLVNDFRHNKSSHIYHNYDTHWNSEGVDIASTIIAQYLTERY